MAILSLPPNGQVMPNGPAAPFPIIPYWLINAPKTRFGAAAPYYLNNSMDWGSFNWMEKEPIRNWKSTSEPCFWLEVQVPYPTIRPTWWIYFKSSEEKTI